MVFYPPAWVPEVHLDLKDSIPLCDFMLEEKHGRHPMEKSSDPYTCGITGKSFSAAEQRARVNYLARTMANEFAWQVNHGSEFDKVVAVFIPNLIDAMTLHWAIHRLNGISTPVNASYSVEELTHQLADSRARFIFTTFSLLPTALAAASKVGIPDKHIYLCEIPYRTGSDTLNHDGRRKTLDQLIAQGACLPELEPLKWQTGQGARQTAFLCYSSGTSGLPKGVMISHFNVIANTLQVKAYNKIYREDALHPSQREIGLGLLPQSHIYSLVFICHASTYHGDQIILLPKFNMEEYLLSIMKYQITTLYLVPPIVVAMIKGKKDLERFNLKSVKRVISAAAPLGAQTASDLQILYPMWHICQAYGLTETSVGVCLTSHHDISFGSSGSLLPGIRCRLVSSEGKEIESHHEPGELWVSSPSVTLGYLNNDKATAETFVEDSHGRWMRTGDEAIIKRSPLGHEHVWIVDRIKEMIKVKGFQVAPAELEAHLLTHPAVADCAVISVPDSKSGELPKAFVVKTSPFDTKTSDESLKQDIQRHVEQHKARYKWLGGGVQFVQSIPKNPSGKILRRLVREEDRDSRRKDQQAKI